MKRTDRRAQAARAMDVLGDIYLSPIASILMLRSPLLGLGLWAVLLQQPALAVMAFVAATLAEGLGWIMSRLVADRFGLPERINTLLAGLVVSWLLLPLQQPVHIILAYVVTGQLLTLLATVIARRALERTGLPVLITPYALVAAVFFTLLPLAVHNSVVAFGWPLLSSASFSDIPLTMLEAMGVIVYSPWMLSGGVVLLLILVNSPVTLAAGLLGWAGGVLVAQGMLLLGIHFVWEVTSYNFLLAGIAAGTAFFVPSRGSMILAPFAGALAALAAAFIQNFIAVPGLSILPIPFVLSAYTLIVALEKGPLKTDMDWLTSPATKWLRCEWMRRRWGETDTPLLALPVACVVRVSQGFDGEITHRGDWRHALDYEGVTQPTAAMPEIWGEPVYAPIRGSVVDTRTDVPENALGTANHSENWGNHVLIRGSDNIHVLLAHLMPGSISVSPDQRVGFSTQVGRVGNSGRSYTPHLHLQAQKEGIVGAPTVPFRLANYLEHDPDGASVRVWRAVGLPRTGDVISVARPVPAVHDALSSLLSGQTIWSVNLNGEAPGWLRLRQPVVSVTSITPSGSHQIRCGADYLEARLDLDGWRIVDVAARPGSLIATLAVAMATVPHCATAGLQWSDVLPGAYPKGMDQVLRAALPFSQRRLQEVSLRCTSVPNEHDAALKLSADVQAPHLFAPDSCTVSIHPKRGPVAAEWRHRTCRLTFTAMTFEAASA